MSNKLIYKRIKLYIKNSENGRATQTVDGAAKLPVYLEYHNGFVELFDKDGSSTVYPAGHVAQIDTDPWTDSNSPFRKTF